MDKITAFDQDLSQQAVKFRDLLKPYRFKLALGGMVLLLTNLIVLSMPVLVNAGVSLISSSRQEATIKLFSWHYSVNSLSYLIAIIVVLALLGGLIRTLSRVMIFDVGRSIERDVRAQVLSHISALDDEFYARHQVGDLMNHLTTDVTNIRLVTGFAVLNLMNIILAFCFTVPLLLRIDLVLGICALLPFPVVMLATRGLSQRIFSATKYYQERLSFMVNHIQENLQGAQVVRLFHQQHAEAIRFAKTNHETFLAGVKLARVRVLMYPIMRMVIGLSLALILWVGGMAVWSGHISLGDFVEINTRISQLTWPAMSIGFVMSMLSRGRASLSRLNVLLTKTPAISDGPDSISELNSVNVIELRLSDKNQQALSFSVQRGEMLGLVGVSGSGKTTLLKMLYRRIKISPGSIFYDHHDIANLKLNSLYKQVAVVSQEPFLFHKSLKENISFLKPDASLTDIEQVIKLVKLDSDIASFKDGLDTIIGERGITLSGGQRQRVALARALLAPRPLIILDDALSAVDAETEQFIVGNLRARLANSIIIIATHRLAAIKDAEQILVLDQGRTSAQGRHQDLMSISQLYRELWGKT